MIEVIEIQLILAYTTFPSALTFDAKTISKNEIFPYYFFPIPFIKRSMI